MRPSPKRQRLRAVPLLVLAIAPCGAAELLEWGNLPPLPRPISGQFAGVSRGALIVAGGSYFPVPLFEGGKKVWVDEIQVLESPQAASWRTFRLGRPRAYGGSISYGDSLILIGGGDAQQNSRDVFRLRWNGNGLDREDLPPLPAPVSNTSAALLGNTVYVAGGQQTPASTGALRSLWTLDLTRAAAGWNSLEPWPGPGRIFPVFAAQDGALYLFSGAELLADAGGPKRRYLRDAFRYQPGKGWTRLPDAPRPMVAAPALASGQSHILVFGGDDGENASRIWELKDLHPGFHKEVLAFHTITQGWTAMGPYTAGLVTTTAVRWGDLLVIPGGEDRPGHRSATVVQGAAAASRAGFRTLDYLVLAVYLLSVVAIGIYFSQRNRDTGEFFLGGKRVPWWAAGLSIYGTQLSSITFMAIPAKSYATDWSFILVNACILVVTPAVVYFYMPFFHRLGVTTAYEYLERRFSLVVRLFASALFVLFQSGRLAVVMFLPAIALATVSNLDVYLCILLMGGLAILYTIFGGIAAVIWTDVVQSVVLLGGAILSLVLAVSAVAGGLPAALTTAGQAGKFHLFDWSWDYTTATVWVLVAGNIASVLATYTTDQTVIQKYLTTADERRAARSIWTNAFLTVPSTIIFFGIGTALFVFYRANPSLLDPALPTDAVFPAFIVQRLPVGIAGLVIAGLFAAAQSTLSSSMHSMATAIVVDFYRPFRPSSSDRSRLLLARVLTFALGAIGTGAALLMATYNIRSLFDVFLTLLSLLGGTLAGVFALGIFTTRATTQGVLAGGFLSAVLVFAVHRMTPVHFFLYAPIGLVSCFVLGYAASLFGPVRQEQTAGLTCFTRAER